ncbi:MAG TPA: polymer-forming cytoskeletal protein [Rhizomicrobium sp.]|nr:polymer-forming cytoskeletal protein [Rhizomicrobium sp.]
MFSSKSRDKDTAPPTIQASASSAPLAGGGNKRAQRSAAPSIISADLVVNGTLTSTGDIQVDGRVEGDVHSSGLVIGDKAHIHGEILADDVTIRGRVQGSIRARKVLLCSTSHVEGNILHEAFSVEAGAFFEGNCRHSDNPLSEVIKGSDSPARPAAPMASTPTPPASLAAKPAEPARPAAAAAAAATLAPLKTGA